MENKKERLERMVELTFLDAVAQAYLENFDDLSRFCFVFPNKRSGAFFLKSLSRMAGGRNILTPEIIAISELVERLSGRQTASRIDLIFRLFRLYREKRRVVDSSSQDRNVSEQIIEFDRFRSWGEILLSDFSEVDQYDVDAGEIFKNVKDYKEISSNFLSDEQIEILEKYFNFRPRQGNIERFWKHTGPGADKHINNKFIELWEQIFPLYEALEADLDKEQLSTQGGTYKHALRRLEELGKEILPWDKIVIVGFNALSTTEAKIFDQLIKIGKHKGLDDERNALVDFYWDATGPVLEPRYADGRLLPPSMSGDAGLFLRLNKRNFPSPEWAEPYMRLCEASRLPNHIEVLAAPSNAAQAKIAGDQVRNLAEMVGPDNIEDARVAVVLPDENLLIPLLYSLPDGLGTINLTMGYSLKYTSTATFIHHLRKLVMRAAKKGEGKRISFFKEDITLLLSHPLSHILFGNRKVEQLNTSLKRERSLMVGLDRLVELGGEELNIFDFTAYSSVDSADLKTDEAIAFIRNILYNIDLKLSDSDSGLVKQKIDRSHIARYKQALTTLESAAKEHNVELGLSGVLYMTDRLVGGEKVTFEGQPLAGLQVMGLLETRALDFEHLVILSMNDKVMPRKSRRSTFIPEALRNGYGLPSANYQERIFSYYFYRMISRAKTVTLLYDARSGEGMRSGGESRYLMQLQYLHTHNNLKRTRYNFNLKSEKPQLYDVEKTPDVMRELSQFREPGSNMNFSASALKIYGTCPVKFYYEVVKKIKTDPAPSDTIDPITQGNIMHDVMLNLYFRGEGGEATHEEKRRKFLPEPIEMTREKLTELMNDTSLIKQTIVRAIIMKHYGGKVSASGGEIKEFEDFGGHVELVAKQLFKQVRDILEYDMTLAPFRLAGGELAGSYQYEFGKGEKVNVKFSIDRLDILKPGSVDEQWRIIDYKTGSAGVKAPEREDIFNGNSSAKNLFQLLFYANNLNDYLKIKGELEKEKSVKLSIYQIESLSKGGEVQPEVEGITLESHKELNDEFFKGRLDRMLGEIFNKDIPFRITQNEENCKYCMLKQLCGKE